MAGEWCNACASDVTMFFAISFQAWVMARAYSQPPSHGYASVQYMKLITLPLSYNLE